MGQCPRCDKVHKNGGQCPRCDHWSMNGWDNALSMNGWDNALGVTGKANIMSEGHAEGHWTTGRGIDPVHGPIK